MSVMLMNSGAYRVQHAACGACGEPLGWKLVRAAEKTEKWKEGFLVLELAALDEAAFPLTPREEAHLLLPARGSAFGSVSRRSVRFAWGGEEEGELGHRRSVSSLSSVDRQKPLGPRQRRDS